MTIFKNQTNQTKKIAAGTGIVLAAVAVIFFVFFLMNREAVICYFSEESEKEVLFEKEEKVQEGENQPENSKAGESESDTGETEPLSIEMEGTEPMADDLRIHGFPYIQLTNQLQAGDYVDVRISFANGADFVLLSKKQVQAIAPLGEEGTNSLWLIVSEEEILRLSSAAVDAYLNDGCSIYAIEYVSDAQKEAVVNYVVSDLVKQLMEEDPNIAAQAENVKEWTKWNEYGEDIQREMVYPQQEEIIYMD